MNKEFRKGFDFAKGFLLFFVLIFLVVYGGISFINFIEDKKEQKQQQDYFDSLPSEGIFEVYQNEDNTECNVVSLNQHLPSNHYGILDISFSLDGNCSDVWYFSRCEVIGENLIKCSKQGEKLE